MKRKILLLLLAIGLMMSVVFAFTSCLDQFQLPTFELPELPQVPGTEDPPEDDEEEKEPEDVVPEITEYRVKFVYDNETVEIHKYTTEFSSREDVKNKADNLLYNGYGFCGYFLDRQLTVPYDFNVEATTDTVIYCKRDKSEAGRNVRWSISDDKRVLTFEGTGDMYDYATPSDVPWNIYSYSIKEVIIPAGITSVAARACHSFKNIKTVVLPDTIVRIGNNAFYESSITSIDFPPSLRTIGENAFTRCTGLTHLYFNQGLEFIERGAFNSCTSVTTVVLTDTIMEFGGSAFNDCNNISSAFYIGTEEQYNSITIRIDNFWIDQLTRTYFISQTRPSEPGPYWYYDDNGDIQQWYYTIWYMEDSLAKIPFTVDYVDVDTGITQSNCDFLNNIVHNGYRFAGWKLDGANYTMRAGTKVYADFKLVGQRGNICGDNLKWSMSGTRLTIQKINNNNSDGRMWDFLNPGDAPWSRANITEVLIKSGVTYIGRYAFNSIYDTVAYSSFTYIDIPASVTGINTFAFYGSTSLLYIFYDGYNPSAVEGIYSLSGLEEAIVYGNAKGKTLSSLPEGNYWLNVTVPSGSSRVAWGWHGNTLTVGAAGDVDHTLPDFASFDAVPWSSLSDRIENLVVCNNVKGIGDYCFSGLAKVIDISVPKTLLQTSDKAFVGTKYYNDALASEGVVYISNKPVRDTDIIWYHLIKVANTESIFVIKERTLSVAENAFEGCSGIKKIVITKDLKPKGINTTSFSGLTSLAEIYFEAQKTTWGLYEDSKFSEIEAAGGVYFYSNVKPSDDGNKYWKWDENNNIIPW